MKFRPCDGIHMTTVGDDGLVLNTHNEQCYQLNRVAVAFWRLMESMSEFDEIIARLLMQFEVEEDRLRADMQSLVVSLQSLGLICEA